MDPVVALVFGLVYLGMLLGEIPGLTLERSGVALLGAIALLAAGRLTPEEAWGAVDVPTIGLLFGLMVVSAQFRLGGFTPRLRGSWPPRMLGRRGCWRP
jgi:Na+/H+ antiporter NhaD/arsenite permease-like protein